MCNINAKTQILQTSQYDFWHWSMVNGLQVWTVCFSRGKRKNANCYWCNEPVKRKRLGRSGTFMAQWFRRWTQERATRGSIPLPRPSIRERVSVSYVWPSTGQITCKSYNRVKFRVSNDWTEAEIMSNFLHVKIGLAQDYGISSTFATGIHISVGSYIYIYIYNI